MNRQTAIKYRKQIEQAAISLTDQDALSVPELFPHWRENMVVSVDNRICYLDKLYRVVQAHTTQTGWEPDKTPALFTEVAKPGEIPKWKQPTGSQDAYQIGDKVEFEGKIYESVIANNTWSPTVYPAGWQEVNV